MMGDGQSVEQLRDYLRKLKPEVRATLVVELERDLLRGAEAAGNHFVLQELRRAIRAAAQPVPRIGDAARRFFAPVEPFLTDRGGDHRRAGRISRSSLEPIWTWIGRDLMPAETKALSEDINRALLANDATKADQLVRALHDRAIRRIKETLPAIGSDEEAQRKFAMQVGTSRAVEDVTTLLAILEVRDILADLAWRLPKHIAVFDRTEISVVKKHVDAATTWKLLEVAPARKSDVMLYGLMMVLGRLAVPWQIIRLATRAAETDDTARIAANPYGVAVTIALNELESTADDLRSDFKAGRPITSMLREFHDAVRGLRTELDLSVDSAWSRQLARIRGEVSNLLKSEVEATPGRLRRLLRPRPLKEIARGSTLDAIDVDEVVARIEFVTACRNYAAELALIEVTTRTYSDLTQYLEAGTKALLDSLRHAEAADRPFRQSQLDAAIRLCRMVFGAEYAGLLSRAADVALQTATTDRASARG
jgi:hypothetical protein